MFARIASLVALAVVAAGVVGCNTVQGVGKDVEAAGRAIEKAAR